MLGRLERAGLVARRRSPRDARSVLVELTRAGVELETAAAGVQHRVECATGLQPAALAALRSQLHDLVDDLCASAAGPHQLEGHAS